MHAILNLARYAPTEMTPEAAELVYNEVRGVVGGLNGAHEASLWQRATGEDIMAITRFDDQDSMQDFERKFVMTDAFFRLQDQIISAPDVERFRVIFHQGIAPEAAPINAYCTTNSYISDPGLENDELAEAKYIMDSLWQIDGFLGAYVGKSLIMPGQLDSVAFWEDSKAVQMAIPIRVNTNLRIYRRMF